MRLWARLGLVAVVAIAAVAVAVAFLRPSSDGVDPGWPIADMARTPRAAGERWGDVVVLIDSSSADIGDFRARIAPYFYHVGVPFAVVDVAAAPPLSGIGHYSLIVLGHRGLTGAALGQPAQTALADAVAAGTGLLSFAGDPWNVGTHAAETATPATPSAPATRLASDVSFADPDTVRTIDLSADAVQQPALPTLAADAQVDTTDGQWTERESPAIGTATILAGVDERARHDLAPMRFAVADVPPADYDVVAELYTGPPGADLRYFFGFAGEAPDARHVDAVGGSGGAREHTEYLLGRISVDSGGFSLHVQHAEVLRGSAPVFGWSRVRLVKARAVGERAHYIAGPHPSWEHLATGPMTLSPVTSAGGTVVAYAGGTPLVTARHQGHGRVVAWSSTEWIEPAVRGPLAGLDDLMWRSIVWAARKPFVLQLLPPLVTMRVDDESGPFEWLHAAVDAGFKPWVGVFLSHIDDRESRDLASIVRGGNATVSVHAFDDPTFFYFDHNGRRDWPAATMAANWRRAVEWHERYDLPISSYVAPHFYEIGANALPLIAGSGVRFVATFMTPGGPYGMPWLRGRPFRLERPGISNSPAPVYYADFLSGQAGSSAAGLFNCVTEIRDDAGYEWYPSPHVDTTVGRGVRQLSRALDSRALATLFTHGYFFPPIPAVDWRRILDLTLAGIATYDPIQMTMEEACGFVRDQQTSALTAVRIEGTGAVHATLAGRAEGPTTLSVFTASGPTIDEQRVVVPAFDGSIDVTAETSSTRTEPR